MDCSDTKDTSRYTKRLRLRIEESVIKERFRIAKPGMKITYHIGNLCIDAEGDEKLQEIRKLVSDWASIGMVSLVQRKIAAYSYEYYAVVR